MGRTGGNEMRPRANIVSNTWRTRGDLSQHLSFVKPSIPKRQLRRGKANDWLVLGGMTDPCTKS